MEQNSILAQLLNCVVTGAALLMPTTLIAFFIVLAFDRYSLLLILTTLGFWLIALGADILRNQEINRLRKVKVERAKR